MNLAAEVGT